MKFRQAGAGARFPAGPLLRRLEELAADGLAAEPALQVAGARAALLDRELLEHDFPFLRAAASGLSGERARTIRLARFLVEQAAFVSRRQARQTAVNSPIATTGVAATAYRPPDYGRALVLPVLHDGRPAGLLDVKGAGVAPRRRPSLAPHRSGLMFLGEALREAMYSRLVDAALRHAGIRCRALPVYGVVDLGFDVQLPSGRSVPAGLLVRRAHRRPSCRGGLKHPGSPLVALELRLELALRRYGLTSAGPMTHVEIAARRGGIAVRWGGVPLRLRAGEERAIAAAVGFAGGTLRIEGTNIQLTREAETAHGRPRPQILDLGAWRARARFENPLASLVALRLLRLGTIVRPGDRRYVQPDPLLGLPQGFLDVECFALARRFRDRALSAAALARRLDAAVAGATAAWA